MAIQSFGAFHSGEQSPSASSRTSLLNVSNNGSVRSPFSRTSRLSASAASIATGASTIPHSLSEKYVLPLDMAILDGPEEDDMLHSPDPCRDRKSDLRGHIFTRRGLVNLGCVFVLATGLVTLFAGYPIITYVTSTTQSYSGAFNLGGTNASGQVPEMNGNFGLIDLDTPEDVRTKADYVNGKTWQLVFSDEFNVEGRSFYPGDDPYWEAVDLHYWQTNNKEWYDPAAITTKNGSLEITLSEKTNHNLNYTGGMMSTWNKFCFTGGLVEASVMLPGYNNVKGLWPAIWAMGNLGRAGYGATLDGMWPYTYDACDVGTVANQTKDGLPVAATEDNDESYDGVLSYLPGQRLSRCTCSGESHPGPVHEDGTYVGRSAPEIDMFEAQVEGDSLEDNYGAVSQSGQWGPFNYQYQFINNSDTYYIEDDTVTELNSYKGGVYQQATSGVSTVDQSAYEFDGYQYSVYGFQYAPGYDDAYIAWISNGALAWRLEASAMAADTTVEISARPVPQEPMYLIMNLGISENFGTVDYDNLKFPSTLRVDWIRVYQDPDEINIGCDPSDFPTAAYIAEYSDAYTNPNYTTWTDDYGQPVPKNSFLDEC